MTTKDAAGHSKLRWHPAFVQAIQMELFDYREYLEYRHEYQLNTAPLQIDLLIIKKLRDIVIDKNIARIFRTDNVVEYKSPEDYLSVSDFWKVCAYANLYAATTPGVDLADVTLTFIGSRHPRKLLRYLRETRGCTVEETSPGIYQVTGDYIPIQIIESQKLSEAENLWLNSLREGLKEKSACAIEEEQKRVRGVNIDAYLDVVLRANPRVFMEAETMAKKRRETLEEVFTEAGLIPEWLERGRVQGLEQGRVQGLEKGLEKGKEIIARNMLRMGMSVEEISQAVELPVEKIRLLV
jgi:hypothetical protein